MFSNSISFFIFSSAEESIHREYRFPDRTHVQQIETTNWVWNLEEVTSFNLKSTDKAVSIPPFDSIVSLVSQRKPVETSSGQEKLNVAEEVSKLKKQVRLEFHFMWYSWIDRWVIG